MFSRTSFLKIFCTFLFSTPFLLASDPPDQIRKAVEASIKKVKPALVQIMVVGKSYASGREQKSQSSGSGAIISADGYIVTNHHVAGHASRLVCILSNKEEIDAELIGTDALTDIAVIKLNPSTPRTFPFVSFGNSTKVRVGDWVLAMGSPRAISQSVTFGVVSNTEMIGSRLSRSTAFQLDGEDVGSIVKWIAHDAAIYGGNSGGPLVNLKGDIVGINEIGFGLGGAIPGNLAKEVALELMKHGVVKRASLGFSVQKQLKHSALRKGVLISGMMSDSPAEKAGFKPGDLLLSLAGKEINIRYAEEMPDFNRFIMSLEVGKEIEAVLLREGVEHRVKITPEERESVKLAEIEFKDWGMTGSNLSLIRTKLLKRPDRNGVYITSIRGGGPCGEAKPSLGSGDIIVALNQEPLISTTDLIEKTKAIRKNQTKPTQVMVTFERNKQQYMSVVKIGVKDLKDPGLEVSKAWLPIKTQVITREMAKLLGIPDETGVRITYVFPSSSASKAGLAVGDLVLRLDDERILAENPEDTRVFSNMIRQYKIGSEAELKIRRNKEEKTISVTLERTPRLAREMRKYQDDLFEFTIRELAFFDKTNKSLPEVEGVIVTEVKPSGWAALGNLRGNDIILSINNKKVNNLEEFKKIMENIYQEKPKAVVLKVLRGIFHQFVELVPDWEQIEAK